MTIGVIGEGGKILEKARHVAAFFVIFASGSFVIFSFCIQKWVGQKNKDCRNMLRTTRTSDA
jgi:hypothetical protein